MLQNGSETVLLLSVLSPLGRAGLQGWGPLPLLVAAVHRRGLERKLGVIGSGFPGGLGVGTLGTRRRRNLGLVRGPRLEKLSVVYGHQCPGILLMVSLCRRVSHKCLSHCWGRLRSVASPESLFKL